ncbi:MAG: NAD(P)/FAD-dependent oxidoreductase [Candidatus Aenigmarchaeota archaeon]|nr:NAD(P)/FAD-dependent oxidoreductase [Candidatus Aenigmarchaeota archaeon]
MYDIVIIGAGPAGLSAAVNTSFLKLTSVVIDDTQAGGALIQAYPWKKVDYFGFYEVSGKELAEIFVEHARKNGVEIIEGEEALDIKKLDEGFEVITTKNSYKGKTVVLATGIIGTPRHLNVKGEDLEGIYYYLKDPEGYRGKKVLVVGGGDSAVENATALSLNGAEVYVAHRRDEFRAMVKNQERLFKTNAKIFWNTEVKEFVGNKKVEEVILFNNKTGEEFELEVDNVFIFIGSVLKKEFFQRLGIEMEGNFVKVNKDFMTNIPGVFAIGDITPGIKRISKAVYEGEAVAFSIFKFLKNPYWGKND